MTSLTIVILHYYCLVRLLVLTQENQNGTSQCRDDQFACGDYYDRNKLSCLPLNVTCDGKSDCFGRDEDRNLCKNRKCSVTEFKCSYGACIPLKTVCNFKNDCYDESDEKNCLKFNKPTNNCQNKLIPCLTTDECISPYQKCDGLADCSDNSDETFLACGDIKCPEYLFKCDYGACVDSSLVCDGKPDCLDYSDERQPYCEQQLNFTSEDICRSSDSFKCGSNMCIEKSKVCDGKRDCVDGLDETYESCSNETCNKTTHYECYYGACVSLQNFTCHDCADNSLPCFAIPRIPMLDFPKGACYYPYSPTNGNYSTITGATIVPSEIAPQWTILQYKCNEGFILAGEVVLICLGTEWNHPPSSCRKACPPLVSKNHEIECLEYERGRNISCARAYDGSIANIKCKELFEVSSALYQPYNAIECRNGSWNHELFDCDLKCGSVTPKGTPLVVQGYKGVKGDYPWHAGIYKIGDDEITQICGGTLISDRVVISAAHCFWDWQTNSPNLNQEDYLVAVGKYYRTWDSPKDRFAQYSCINRIDIPPKFRADQSSYAHDIAILILNETLQLSALVRPICVDWGDSLYRQLLKAGNWGLVVGWGLTEEGGDPSEELQVARMPYVAYDECFKSSPLEFRPFITDDKICAGFKNGTSVCTGDSGGGLAFEKSGRFFVGGVVSISPGKQDSCDASTFAAFTSIPKHLPLIRRIESDVSNNL